jgi:hypothetical protein
MLLIEWGPVRTKRRVKTTRSGRGQEAQMFKSILVPTADTDLAKPAIATVATLSQT